MIAEHVTLTVRPGAGDDLRAAFESIRSILLAAEGCSEATLSRSVDRDDTFLLRAVWNRLEDHTDVFAASSAGAQVRELIQPLCAAVPEVVHYET
ncbi:antibiotic biosynthesis monooxygenase [Rhodococcus sp. BP-149]|uniref:antibiotic biosynthesis monooxygenase family protein n=1 Tax=unclassified Rhodococcus (in: high G+C Gram-positive bacteria) TaxID=192944 RepID=UPI001C9B4523|nr:MULTISPECIES: antibiotic biosynthesis monooxygenase family protein [unclassified Rhodococcus (in: high G+C Gram-positive bacteria)]MBY6685614.1 antibiotic biosynthesis monooxygenase [Rhodococcus sp. BP-288]MBY6694838.1 antibiotic biosynthesis monooxygenase [Rhodococcus sp. BP-188]MBY6696684.1 antibiotic biosynthesis monooxygenase [Rhodococcus sp. BP-285]MBY6703340.1 antibiotic biosynthesis monooxygenase [Rhodococcus sp. BP-283]MBY6708663.1 antibiotic biosynthesis monooxygenase [Rhodococcus 